MFRCMFRTKLHRATVTMTDLHYEGSIAIDEMLLKEAGILVGEKVQVLNINNGERIETYAIPAPAESGQIMLNGAAARLFHKGDKVIIIAYSYVEEKEAPAFHPRVIVLDERNRIAERKG